MVRSFISRRIAATIAAVVVVTSATAGPAYADPYVPISGAGSSWAAPLVYQSAANVRQFGLTVNYADTGATDGRNRFRSGVVDFAVSEVPYGLDAFGVSDQPPTRPFSYVPFVAGATVFAYNLKVGTTRVTNLRLSSSVLAGIFTGRITAWNDPQIHADNPGIALPPKTITPVVRLDASGTTLQLTSWLAAQQPARWREYCAAAGLPEPCAPTMVFPVAAGSGLKAFAGSNGVAGYVKSALNDGAITYVEASYALNLTLPTAKVLNTAGYYTAPTAAAVGVALTGARINPDQTADLSGVYANPDPRAYPLSGYAYLIVPTSTASTFSAEKGHTLTAFAAYGLCAGQGQAEALGYAPLPVNLVRGGFEQLLRIPGGDPAALNLATCANPTFTPDGTDMLLSTAPMPNPCDQQGTACGGLVTGAAEFLQTTVVPGALTITVAGSGVVLPPMALTSDASLLSTAGMLPAVTVSDTRAGNPGWNISGQVGDFSDGAGHVIAGANLGWSPVLVSKQPPQVVVLGAVVVPAAGAAPGAPVPSGVGLAGGATLATAAPLGGNGTTMVGAELTLNAPTSTPPGTYSATLTFTVI
ncbi:phosphate ABC transporter substrate-binding protein PstS [Catellatospora sp. TT07R-123]|uniref:phosphate ABC transporter substrate-binding protein PstS n=1 Tax=Catellatospora sp. TT07R-123 TaxID=2733863 RepID=UPI001B0DF4EE|nr:phosphate ABC transporter substrate-binding protein PstS [Catellatospora sp. TT07R-123]GHJ45662.1 phosphate ABC transporter substrate-binding protein PstS [Catellatospora sp. TT07R-123]